MMEGSHGGQVDDPRARIRQLQLRLGLSVPVQCAPSTHGRLRGCHCRDASTEGHFNDESGWTASKFVIVCSSGQARSQTGRRPRSRPSSPRTAQPRGNAKRCARSCTANPRRPVPPTSSSTTAPWLTPYSRPIFAPIEMTIDLDGRRAPRRSSVPGIDRVGRHAHRRAQQTGKEKFRATRADFPMAGSSSPGRRDGQRHHDGSRHRRHRA